MCSALRNHESIAKLLVSRKADINASGRSGNKPLHYACQSQNKRTIELLLLKKANINAKDARSRSPVSMHIDVFDQYKSLKMFISQMFVMQLHILAYLGNANLLKRLIRQGAHINARDSDGNNALHFAIANRKVLLLLSCLCQFL